MPSALVAKIRAKYGDAYADMSDDELETKVLTKYPQYADLASANARRELATGASVTRATEGAQARTDAPSGPEAGFWQQLMETEGARATGEAEGLEATGKGGLTGLALTAGAASIPTTLAGAGHLAASGTLGYLGEKALGAGAAAIGAPRWIGSTLGALAGGGAPSLGRRAVGKLLAGRFAGPAPVSIPAGASSSLTALPAAAVRGAATGTPAGATLGELAGLERTLVESGWAPAAAREHAGNLGRRATDAVRSEASKAVPKALPETLTQEQLRVVTQLKAAAQQSGASKIQVVQAAQQVFPDNWKQVVDFVMAPRTTMGVR